ncbi:unnamed protein product [Urochloa decumbens]|uniref:DUF1618 domain-containing protein n=1 Tax=Urochloa decumbens TaxID=240449 RepID=A0ABC8WI70_9POAL
MATPWVILGRFLRVDLGPGDEQAEEDEAGAEHAAAMDADARERELDDYVAAAEEEAKAEGVMDVDAPAEHAAAVDADARARELTEHVAAAQEVKAEGFMAVDAPVEHAAAAPPAEPDFILRVALPPRVTVLAAGLGAQPDPRSPDKVPYLVAAGPLCLLLHFDSDHLVLARDFHPAAEGHTTASAALVPERPPHDMPVVRNIEDVVFGSNDRGDYTIAELQVRRPRATLFCLRSGGDQWSVKEMPYPLPSEDREWIPHGSVSTNDTLWWFDLSWGILSYCASLEDPELIFHHLPRARSRAKVTKGIHKERCITASRDKLRYLDIVTEGSESIVSMWSWSPRVHGGWRWEKNYSMRLRDLWDDDSYRRTGLPRDVPVPAIVCPSDNNLVYFALDGRLFGVIVPAHRVVHQPDGVLDILGPPTPSAREVVAWGLQPSLAQALGRNAFADFHTNQLDVNILEIWAYGVESAFEDIREILTEKGDDRYFVAFDTEFAVPDRIEKSQGEPSIPDGHYRQLCTYVNRGNLVQVGLGFADEQFNLIGGKIFQFNIHFDTDWRAPGHKGVEVMHKAGLKLHEHRARGIPAVQFMELLSESGILWNDSLDWITFNGYTDFGFLIRHLRGQNLPLSCEQFLTEFKAIFPSSYDCKVFSTYGQCLNNPIPGGLKGVAEKLQVERGKEHQAASDALLALRCYQKLTTMRPDFAANIRSLLYGICVCVYLYGVPRNF